ncbi:hypothetical protein [Eisenbergiella tayi]|uniref:hypothetical protein n=1 Tax=Eisenbergiella tayi TaxID=1432052 RepID=UPI00135CA870|nr:hypothetical protein [Eisenbergiella tayi]
MEDIIQLHEVIFKKQRWRGKEVSGIMNYGEIPSGEWEKWKKEIRTSVICDL